MNRRVWRTTMSYRLPALALALAGSSLFLGCTGAESFRTYAHEGEEGNFSTALDDFSDSDFGAFVHPVIDSFSAQPLYLPLGGGEVELSWSVRQATSCSLLIDGQSNVVGTEGMAVITVDSDTTLELLCIDGDDAFDAVTHEVVVQSPPVEFFGESPSVLESPDFAKVTTQSKFAGQPVIELRLSLAQTSRVSLMPAAVPLRSGVTLWLAQDSNEDGVVDPDEIIAIARSAAEAHISAVLEGGDYTLFIESDGVAVDWSIASYITPLGGEPA
jgi:hypothetical protein